MRRKQLDCGAAGGRWRYEGDGVEHVDDGGGWVRRVGALGSPAWKFLDSVLQPRKIDHNAGRDNTQILIHPKIQN